MRKISFKGYFAWNFDKEEEELNRKSKQGWQAVKCGCFRTVYEKDDTVCYRYRIDYNSKMIGETDEKQRYIELFAEQGWEYIKTTFNGWIYFKKKCMEGLTEEDYKIYTDKESLFEMFGRWIKLARIAQTILGIGVVILLFMLFRSPHLMLLVVLVLYGICIMVIQRGTIIIKSKRNK